MQYSPCSSQFTGTTLISETLRFQGHLPHLCHRSHACERQKRLFCPSGFCNFWSMNCLCHALQYHLFWNMTTWEFPPLPSYENLSSLFSSFMPASHKRVMVSLLFLPASAVVMLDTVIISLCSLWIASSLALFRFSLLLFVSPSGTVI